jgi:hypothetical protein
MPSIRLGRHTPTVRQRGIRSAVFGTVVLLGVAGAVSTVVSANSEPLVNSRFASPDMALVNGVAASSTTAFPQSGGERLVRGLTSTFGQQVLAVSGIELVLGAPAGTAQSGGSGSGWHAGALQAAEAEVAHTWALLRQARAEQARVQASPEIVTLAAAQRDVTEAQARVARADTALQRLNQPDSLTVDAAERAVWRAEATLRAARSLRPVHDPMQNPIGNAWEIRQAELLLQEAVTRRDAARVGPSPQVIASARTEREHAQTELAAATARVDQLRQGLTPPPVDASNAAVVSAIASLTEAEARLQSLRSTMR